MTLGAVLGISNHSNALNVVTSSLILLVEATIIFSFVRTLLENKPHVLSLEASRKKIGNLYEGLKLSSLYTLLYGQIFFLQRLLIVCAIIYSPSFAIQTFLVIGLIIMRILYLVTYTPF
jgi:hypothetical protein